MRLRIIILVLALLAVLSVSSGGFLYYFSLKHAALQQAQGHSDRRLELLGRQLNSSLAEHVKPAKALAGIGELRDALGQKDAGSIMESNLMLDNFTRSLNLEVCYLMDRDGVTVASSNRNDYDSFVGKNFSFRPYFIKALSGRPDTYFALGTTSRKRGVYHSHPVYSAQGEDIVGVAVIKASVEQIESMLFVGSEGILLVTDPNGIIFIANRREMRFMLLWSLAPEEIENINASRQFGNGPWLWTGFSSPVKGRVVDRNGREYIHSEMSLEGYPGWRIVHLRSLDEIKRQLADPFIQIAGPVIVVIAAFMAVAVFILYKKALHEIVMRKKAEGKLRISEARYRHIYHKTPVMLHSIDTGANIIRVSDYWLEKMGYERDEVIGRKLTDFYSEESKKYAEEVILPFFFKSGFCKDVPYTYVKKNGETIDILLSCYGVRDNGGRVKISLAVSVDVTEKNQVQKALEKAREKLSSYSMDLEHQVEMRTNELTMVRDQLRRLSGGIMAAHENERRALARELHDHFGQILTALKMDAVWLRKHLPPADKKAGERALRICSLIDDTIGDVREMAFRLRPGVLDDLGLVDALEMLTREFEKRTDISCGFRHGVIPELHDSLATAFYRIAQEAVTNALRHSGATEIMVGLFFVPRGSGSLNRPGPSPEGAGLHRPGPSPGGAGLHRPGPSPEGAGLQRLDSSPEGAVELTVEDNGRGFVPEEKKDSPGLGLTGMKERATLAGGVLDIIAMPGKGCRVVCRVTLENTSKKEPVEP
ncbi:MAG: PAS domain S-box protein [Desulfamplus sp.]|nr:PAS domain S-box protein [Desulfamplus sp.]